jgi:hypothetical protein
MMYRAMRDELLKISQPAGSRIAGLARARGVFDAMNVGALDPEIQGLVQQLSDMAQAGQYGEAQQMIQMGGFPAKTRQRLQQALQQLRAQHGIANPFRHAGLYGALES